MPTPASTAERVAGYALEFIPLFFLALIPVIGGLMCIAYTLFRDAFGGQSVGKWVMRTRVIRAKGGCPASFRESVLRNLPFSLKFVFMIIPVIGHFLGLMVAFVVLSVELCLVVLSAEHVRFGDRLAGTRVVKLNAAP